MLSFAQHAVRRRNTARNPPAFRRSRNALRARSFPASRTPGWRGAANSQATKPSTTLPTSLPGRDLPRYTAGVLDHRPGSMAATARNSGRNSMVGPAHMRTDFERAPRSPRSAVAASTATASAQTIKIGLINSYSGFLAQAGDEMQKGIDLYVKDAREGPAAGRQGRADQARRHRGARGRQARRAGADHARSRPAPARRRRLADRRRDRAADAEAKVPLSSPTRPASRHPAHLALCRARLLHAVAGGLSARPMGRQAGLEERLHRGERLHPRPRRRGRLHQGLEGCRRQDRRLGALPDRQSRISRRSCSASRTPSPTSPSSWSRPASRRPRC